MFCGNVLPLLLKPKKAQLHSLASKALARFYLKPG